jgi:hypothetical protein
LGQRKKESDGKALLDSPAVYTKMLDRDWKRLVSRDSFLHHFNVKRMPVEDGEKLLGAMRDALLDGYAFVHAGYRFYSTLAPGNDLVFGYQAWNRLITDCNVPGEIIPQIRFLVVVFFRRWCVARPMV